MKKLLMLLLLSVPLIFCSCELQGYRYRCKIYYIDGSIDTISFVSYDEPFICSARNGYYFHGDRTIQAVDRFVILSKKEIK